MRRRQRWTAGRVISKASPLKGRGEDRKESNLPPRMDRHQPAEHRLDVRVHEPCRGDAAFEGRRDGAPAARFGQLAIDVLVILEPLADSGDDMLSIGVVKMCASQSEDGGGGEK